MSYFNTITFCTTLAVVLHSGCTSEYTLNKDANFKIWVKKSIFHVLKVYGISLCFFLSFFYIYQQTTKLFVVVLCVSIFYSDIFMRLHLLLPNVFDIFARVLRVFWLICASTPPWLYFQLSVLPMRYTGMKIASKPSC
jgi:hypothetical protein